MGRLDGKVAIITGAASGMGETTSRRFIEEDAKVVLADIDDKGQDLADELGENAVFIKLDVSDEENWKNAVKETEDTFGPVNILVNNAGIYQNTPIAEYPLEDFKNIIEINQIGVFLGMKTVYPSMSKTDGGSIINMSSGNGFVGEPNQIAYDSSKFAVRGMTKTAAHEFSPEGIRVNSVHPGSVKTGLVSDDLSEDHQDEWSADLPIRRAGAPEEVTNMITYLASDESSYSTGAEFKVDGGWTA